jgi:hypothetical protein
MFSHNEHFLETLEKKDKRKKIIIVPNGLNENCCCVLQVLVTKTIKVGIEPLHFSASDCSHSPTA